MTDYNKLTVANLRAVLKDRGIPSTGLTRKAQIIEKLEEADREGGAQTEAHDAPQNDGEAADTQATLEKEEKAEKKDDAPLEAAVSSAAQDATESEDAKPGQPAATETQITIQPSEAAAAPTTADSSMTMPTDDAPMPPPATSIQETTTQPALPTSESRPSQTPKAPPESQDVPPVSHEPSVAPLIDSVKPEELAEDSKKRKRRSATPPVLESEVVNKKLRQDDDDGTVHLKEDAEIATAAEDKAGTDAKPAEEPMAEGDEVKHEQEAPKDSPAQDASAHLPKDESAEHGDRPRSSKGPERDGRYKDLLRTPPSGPSQRLPESSEVDDKPVEPAIHPATAALYIRNFMRPLHPGPLKSHLISLATGPSSPPDESLLKAFFLDPIRSHAFARFTSLSAAARVRSALHDRKWPEERDRRNLWVDFVPEEKVEDWIAIEQEGGGGGGRPGNKRWEVIYDETRNGDVEVFLREAGSGSISGPSRPNRDVDRPPPNGPSMRSPISRRPTEAERPAPSAPAQPKEAGKSFVALDKLFSSTTAKPKLYFLPVSNEISDKRLDEFDRLTSRDWKGGRGLKGPEELRRYTFEDNNMLVDGGAHFTGARARERERDLGGRGPPRGGGGGGGYGRRDYRPR